MKSIKMNKKELIDEHKHLIRVLKKGRKKELKKEAKKQEHELEGYIEKAHVKSYTRTTKTGKVVQVREHDDKRLKKNRHLVPLDVLNEIRSQKKDNDYRVDNLEELIEKNGFTEPVTVTFFPFDGKVVLTDGHHRLEAAERLGISEVPVRINVDYGDADRRFKNSAKKVTKEYTYEDIKSLDEKRLLQKI